MNEEQKNINEFEDLFEKHNIDPNPPLPRNNQPYLLAILYYFLVMFVLSTIVGVLLLTNDSLTVTINQDQRALNAVAAETAGMTLLPTSIYLAYDDAYEGYIESIGTYNEYKVIINTANLYAYDLLLDDDNQLLPLELEKILLGSTKSWDTQNKYEIFIYESSLHPIPGATTDNLETIDQAIIDLSNFAYALHNFIIYIALTPVLALLILKRDLIDDFTFYKKRWNQFIPAVFIGYALVLVGNFVANLSSQLVGSLLGVMPSTAVNQMSIEQTLQSNGVVFILLSAVVLGPIAEELIFRKAIFSLFKNEKIALTVSALSFGAVHLLSETNFTDVLVNGLVYIILGVVFGYIYIRNNKNIGILITVHMLSNLISVLSVLFL